MLALQHPLVDLQPSDWAGRRFSLRAATSAVLLCSHLVLEADGRIGGIDHPNLRRWQVEDGHLCFFTEAGGASCRFDATDEDAATLTGRFLLQAGQPVLWLERERFVDLTALANTFGTDKGTTTGDRHGYTEIYASMFEAFRLDAFNFVEIGLLICTRENEATPEIRAPDVMPSMDMWLSYFPNATCFGFDLSDFSAAAARRERFTFLRGDLSKDEDIARLAGAVGTPRVIIDDASHAAFHQQRTFAAMFPVLAPGGFYVIEDLHYSPPFESDLPPCKRMWHVLRILLDEKRLALDFCDAATNAALAGDIEHVFMHCSARGPGIWGPKLVVIQKKR